MRYLYFEPKKDFIKKNQKVKVFLINKINKFKIIN